MTPVNLGELDMEEAREGLTADQAIDLAFDYFERFVDRGQNLQNVLLEELQPQADGWIVSIGFDGSRQEISEPAYSGAVAALSGFGQKTTKYTREIRHFHIDGSGGFQKMT
ncbi:hypothetical protein [Rhodosalinus halophilus]|uniref:hypothetical protein n=1 Tax=Rhodosalinus halophilus TaxID=2259333 RepID=UPI0011BE8812|nr:hypothetical protein [Rhodosalinus halophilus]